MDISAAAIGGVSQLAKAASDGDSTPGRLMQRLFGPTADVLGAALAQYAEFRVANFIRIAEFAAKKIPDGANGSVHPRVAGAVLDGASWCDDPLMAEYFGGLLASAYTPSGRDDRAVAWERRVEALTSLELRAHFLIYREIALDRPTGDLISYGTQPGRDLAFLEMPYEAFYEVGFREFAKSINASEGLEASLASEALQGLRAVRLIEGFEVAHKSQRVIEGDSAEYVVRVQPSYLGFSLYAWAHGVSGIDIGSWADEAASWTAEVDVPRVEGVNFPLRTAAAR